MTQGGRPHGSGRKRLLYEAPGLKSERYPFGWQLDLAKESRGAAILVQLTVLVKDIAKKRDSDRLIEELVASGHYRREELGEHYVNKTAKKNLASGDISNGLWPIHGGQELEGKENPEVDPVFLDTGLGDNQ